MKTTFITDTETFSLNTLRIFTRETGTVVEVKDLCIIDKGEIIRKCHKDKLCKKTCDSNSICHVKRTESHYDIKDD